MIHLFICGIYQKVTTCSSWLYFVVVVCAYGLNVNVIDILEKLKCKYLFYYNFLLLIVFQFWTLNRHSINYGQYNLIPFLTPTITTCLIEIITIQRRKKKQLMFCFIWWSIVHRLLLFIINVPALIFEELMFYFFFFILGISNNRSIMSLIDKMLFTNDLEVNKHSYEKKIICKSAIRTLWN